MGLTPSCSYYYGCVVPDVCQGEEDPRDIYLILKIVIISICFVGSALTFCYLLRFQEKHLLKRCNLHANYVILITKL